MPSLSNDVKVTVSTSADTKGIKDTENSLSSLSRESDNTSGKTGILSNAFSGFGSTIAAVGAAFAGYQIIQKIEDFGSMAVKSAAELQETSQSFKVLIGNTEQANHLFADLANYANNTPFEFSDVAKAGKTLLGFGIVAGDVMSTTKNLGDISAVTGANLGSLSTVYGQVIGAGKLQAQDWHQLINMGIPINQMLQKVGVNTKDLGNIFQKGGIDAATLTKAFQQADTKGSFAFQGTTVLANTFNGRISTMKDTVADFGRQLLGVKVDPELGLTIQPGGLFDRLANGVSKVTKGLHDFAPVAAEYTTKFVSLGTEVATRLGEGFQKRLTQVMTIGGIMEQNIKDSNWTGLGEQLSTGFIHALKSLEARAKDILGAINHLMSSVDWMAIGINFGSKVLPGLALGIIAGFLNLDIGKLFRGVMDHWQDIAMAVLAIAFAPAKIIGKVGQILAKIPFAGKLLEWGLLAINDFGHAILNKVAEWLGLFGQAFIDRLGFQGPRIVPAVINFLRNIPNAIGSFMGTVDNKIGEMMISMGNTIANLGPRQVVGAMQAVKNALFSFLGDAGSWLYNVGKSIIQGMLNGIGDMAGNVAGKISGVAGSIGSSVKGALHSLHIPGFASGVRNFSGGLAVVGEQGPELVNLPSGSDVLTNSQSQRLAGGNTSHQAVTITFAGPVYMTNEQEAQNVGNQLARQLLAARAGSF